MSFAAPNPFKRRHGGQITFVSILKLVEDAVGMKLVITRQEIAENWFSYADLRLRIFTASERSLTGGRCLDKGNKMGNTVLHGNISRSINISPLMIEFRGSYDEKKRYCVCLLVGCKVMQGTTFIQTLYEKKSL